MKYIKHPWIFLIISFIITISIKIPHLGLPYFFDETFSYVPAIREMAKVGPNLMPGTIGLYLSKGHPLLFYFLASSWMKFIAGNSIALMRVFPLLIALLALFVFHRFANRHTNITLANIGVVFLSLQPIFLAQASLVLPEIFIFILFTQSFDSFLLGNYRLYALWGSLMILTKETGAVFILVFGIVFLVENYRAFNTKEFWKELFLLFIPVLIYATFLILHFLKFGVFFFSDHLNYITIESEKVLYKLNSANWVIFLAHGRNVVSFTAMLALIILLYKKQDLKYIRFLVLTIVILVAFFAFSMLNFFTYRYVIPVFGISILALLAIIQQIKSKSQIINIAFVVCILSLSAYNTATRSGHTDADLGYVQFLNVQQQMVKYCEDQGYSDREICVGLNMTLGMRNKFAGYLSSERNFKTRSILDIDGASIVIYDSTCEPYEMPDKNKENLTLIKRFQFKNHWGEIYKSKKPLQFTNQ